MPPPDESGAVEKTTADRAEALLTGTSPRAASDMLTSEQRHAWGESQIAAAEDERNMRKWIAWAVFAALAAQITIADTVFIIYGDVNDWKIPEQTIIAWLSATVVQVVALALAITSSLFPRKSR